MRWRDAGRVLVAVGVILGSLVGLAVLLMALSFVGWMNNWWGVFDMRKTELECDSAGSVETAMRGRGGRLPLSPSARSARNQVLAMTSRRPIYPRQRRISACWTEWGGTPLYAMRALGANETEYDGPLYRLVVSEEDGMFEGESRRYRDQRRAAKRGL